jgi:hypothetical protein
MNKKLVYVGAGVLVLFLLFRKKSSAKPTQVKNNAPASNPASQTKPPTVASKPEPAKDVNKPFPADFAEKNCPDGFAPAPRGGCLPIDYVPPIETPIDEVIPRGEAFNTYDTSSRFQPSYDNRPRGQEMGNNDLFTNNRLDCAFISCFGEDMYDRDGSKGLTYRLFN